MNKNNDGYIRPMTEADLLHVLNWRNHPDIRQFMYQTHEITFDEHLIWFQRESNNKNRHLLIFEYDNTASGFINLLQKDDIVEWGFYVAPNAAKGLGLFLGNSVLNYVFNQLCLHKIMGHVLEFNVKSMKFHQKLGFTQEGLFREHYFDGLKYHNIVYYGLLRHEWEALSRSADDN